MDKLSKNYTDITKANAMVKQQAVYIKELKQKLAIMEKTFVKDDEVVRFMKDKNDNVIDCTLDKKYMKSDKFVLPIGDLISNPMDYATLSRYIDKGILTISVMFTTEYNLAKYFDFDIHESIRFKPEVPSRVCKIIYKPEIYGEIKSFRIMLDLNTKEYNILGSLEEIIDLMEENKND